MLTLNASIMYEQLTKLITQPSTISRNKINESNNYESLFKTFGNTSATQSTPTNYPIFIHYSFKLFDFHFHIDLKNISNN